MVVMMVIRQFLPPRRLSVSMGTVGQVRFLTKALTLRDHLPGQRAYLHGSEVKSLSLTVIDAMAAGLPVVAEHVGGPQPTPLN